MHRADASTPIFKNSDPILELDVDSHLFITINQRTHPRKRTFSRAPKMAARKMKSTKKATRHEEVQDGADREQASLTSPTATSTFDPVAGIAGPKSLASALIDDRGALSAIYSPRMLIPPYPYSSQTELIQPRTCNNESFSPIPSPKDV